MGVYVTNVAQFVLSIQNNKCAKDVLLYYGFIYQYGSWVFKAKKHEVI